MNIKKIIIAAIFTSISFTTLQHTQQSVAFGSSIAQFTKKAAAPMPQVVKAFYAYGNVHSIASMLGDISHRYGFETSSPNFNYMLYMLAGYLARHFTIAQLQRFTKDPAGLSGILIPAIASIYFGSKYGMSYPEFSFLLMLTTSKLGAFIAKSQLKRIPEVKPHLP